MSSADDRLRAATAAIAEREHLARVRGLLANDVAAEVRRVEQLRVELRHERADVERLTVGAMSFLHTILAGDGALAKEQREVAEAEARLHEAQGSLDLLRGQAAAVEARLARLDPAELELELAAARAAKAEALARGHTPAGAQLADLAIRVESIDIELVPLADAVTAADAAFEAVVEIVAILDGLATSQTAEVPAGRTRALAGEAQAKLVVLGGALSEVAPASFAVTPAVDPRDTGFADAWVRGLFGAGPRAERLAAARAEMAARCERVGAIRTPLRARHDELAARRAALLAERARLLDA